MSSNVLGRKVVAKALKYEGTKSGDKKHRQILNIFNEVSPHGYSARVSDYWCDIFVSAIWISVGLTSADVPLSCNVDVSIADAKKLGIWKPASHKPRAGDAIILDWDVNGRPNHIGFVRKVTKNTVYTIEGNAGDKGVCKRKSYNRDAKIIFGYICPKYNAIYIDYLARRYAWAKGTDKSKYTVKKGGKPNRYFRRAWRKHFPKRKMGSGCHQFVMLVMRVAGYKVMPLAWGKIISYMKERCTSVAYKGRTSQLRKGDIMMYRRIDGKGIKRYHIWIVVKVDGKLMIAEANQGRYYAHINPSLKKATKSYNKVWLFRPKEVK